MPSRPLAALEPAPEAGQERRPDLPRERVVREDKPPRIAPSGERNEEILMRIRLPEMRRRWGSRRQRSLFAVAVVLALGMTGTEIAVASGALATAPSAPAVGTLASLPYTFPAGSGG